MAGLSAVGLALAVLCWPVRRTPAALALPRHSGRGARGRCRARPRVRPQAAEPADQMLQVLDMVAAQVRAGAAPAQAWAAALDVVPAAGTAPTPDPVADLLRWARRAGGRDRGDRAVVAAAAQAAAAAWRLAEHTGAPLGELLDTVCATVRADQADRAGVEAALAGPRATSRLLLALPVAGIALGELIGAAPLHVLGATPAGRACAVTGGALLAAGRVWMRRQVAAVEALAWPARRVGARSIEVAS